MRVRIKEIRRARKRQVDRWKTAHKGTAIATTSGGAGSAAPAARPAAPGRSRPAGGR